MKKTKLTLISITLTISSLTHPALTFADEGPKIKCDGDKGIDTAIGCIPIGDFTAMATFFFRWGISLAGGIAFLMILYSGFLYISSTGDPKKVQAAQELFVAAVGSIFFLIFAIFVLRVFGVDILGITELGV